MTPKQSIPAPEPIDPVATRFYTRPFSSHARLMRDELETRFANLAAWVYASFSDNEDRARCIEALELATFHGRNAIRSNNARSK